MGVTEWVLLIVVVILIPLAIAVAVTLWSLEQARQRNRKNRPGSVRRVAVPTDSTVDGAASEGSRLSSDRDEPVADGSVVRDGDGGSGVAPGTPSAIYGAESYSSVSSDSGGFSGGDGGDGSSGGGSSDGRGD